MIPPHPSNRTYYAMDGNSTRLEDRWIIEISAGNVPFNNGEDFRLYDRNTGESFSPTGDIPEDGPMEGVGFEYNGTVYEVFFNDNDDNGRVNRSDTIVIVDPDGHLEDLDFRITVTNLQVTL